MSAISTTMQGRAAAEALMTDACVVRRVTGRVLDQTSLEYVDTTAVVYSGACRVRAQNVQDSEAEAGERTVTLRGYVVSVPVVASGVHVNDVAEVTASVLDPELPGTLLRVLGPAKGSTITARRFRCEEVTS
jgi:hypothetical protein